MDVKKRIEELITLINQSNHEYYVLDNPSISDYEYDKLITELVKLETEFPKYLKADSPSQRVGGEALKEFKKVEHKIPLYSLANAFSYQELEEFDNRVKKSISNYNYICELKIDGISVALTYQKGILIQAATRGDGQVGEDITANVKTIKSIPLKLKKDVDLEVRGELFIDKKTFFKLNEQRKETGENLFQNPRNATAGSVRNLDPKITAQRKLDCYVYSIPNSKFKTQEEVLKYLDILGFKVNKKYQIGSNLEACIEVIKNITKERKNLNYEIDGIVIKINELKYHEQLGQTTKYPRWAIAYKFPALETKTKLIDIVWNVGRTSQLTPVAILNPVEIDGSTVAKATLHNEENIIAKEIKIGDTVIIRKAGDIIPEVVEVDKNSRTGQEQQFKMINNCPICKSKLQKNKSEIGSYCPNPKCDSKIIESLIHFASRNVMDIFGLGERIVEELYNLKFIKHISDIYLLKERKNELINLEGFGKKSVDNLLLAIENSKKNSLEKLIFGLGINEVGEKYSKILAKHFLTLDNLKKAPKKELISIFEIGEVIADNIINYFNDKDNIKLLNDLKSFNLNFKYLENNHNQIKEFNEKIFVITGTFSNYSRKELEVLIEENGGQIRSKVTKNVDVLLKGSKPGSKYDDALNFNVDIWDEIFLLKILTKVKK